MKDCNSCKHFWYDNSTGTSECGQYDNMTEDETDKYYTNGEDNCPFYNENLNVSAKHILKHLLPNMKVTPNSTKKSHWKPIRMKMVRIMLCWLSLQI